MSTVKAVVIENTGNAALVDLDTSLESLQAVIGGYLQIIQPMVPGYGKWHAYIDEEGKIKDRPRNFTADDIAVMLGWGGAVAGDFIVGPMVLLGETPDGEEADVPQKVIDAVLAYYDRHGTVEIHNHRK
jgi:hypothetical protein